MELANANFSKTINAKILDNKLYGLQWISPNYINNPTLELEMLKVAKKKIIKDMTNKIIITDYQFLSAITENLHYAPNKWFDALSVPTENNKYFKTYKLFFISKIQEQKIKNIYVIGEGKLDHFLFIFANLNICSTPFPSKKLPI